MGTSCKFIRPKFKNLFWNIWATELVKTNLNHESLKKALDDLNPFAKKGKYLHYAEGNLEHYIKLIKEYI